MICGISYGSVILRWQLFQLFQGKSEYTSASQFITPKARSISKLNEIIARLLDEGLAQGMRLKSVKHRILRDEKVQKPSWRSWLARQSHNLKVVSSSLTEGILVSIFILLVFLIENIFLSKFIRIEIILETEIFSELFQG